MKIPFRTGIIALILFCLLATSCARQVEPVQRPLDGGQVRLAWTYESGSAINLSPLLVGELLLVAPQDGPLLALDAETGRLVWQFSPPEGLWERALAGAGKTIYVGLRGGKIAALDARDGTLRWQTSLGIEVQAPPVIDQDTLFVPTTFVGPGLAGDPDGRAVLFALRAKNGELLWRFESQAYILQTPFVNSEQVYVGGSYSNPAVTVDEGGPLRLYALSRQDGDLIWQVDALDGYVKSLYAHDGYLCYIAYTDFVPGLDAGSGEELWRQETGNWVPALSGFEGTIYFGSANTVIHARDIRDGSLIWNYNIPEGSFNYALGAPVRAGDSLYFLTQIGEIFALNALDGSLQWSLATEARARVGLTVGSGAIFIGDEKGTIFAFLDH